MKLWYIILRKKFWLPRLYRWHREEKIDGARFASREEMTNVFEELAHIRAEAAQHANKEVLVRVDYTLGFLKRIVKYET